MPLPPLHTLPSDARTTQLPPLVLPPGAGVVCGGDVAASVVCGGVVIGAGVVCDGVVGDAGVVGDGSVAAHSTIGLNPPGYITLRVL